MGVKREAKFTLRFRSWIRANPFAFSCVFELKQTRTDSIAFRALEEHQEDALRAASTGALLYKIPDDTRGYNPFDMFYMRHCQAFIVIKFPDFFCIISFKDFIDERQISQRKSLTAKRAQEIAIKVVNI